MKKNVLLWSTLGVLWLGGVVTGLGWLAGYSNRPGVAARAPAMWPSGSRIAPASDRPTLVMLLHPRCGCSKASVAELAELLARATTKPRTYVLLLRPADVAEDWERTDLWQAAAEIPGVTLVRDDGGAEALRFGAGTSGQTLLYGAEGRLLFCGGLTSSRGHPGESAGRAAILALLHQETPSTTQSPVFGCELFGTDEKGPTDAKNTDSRAAR